MRTCNYLNECVQAILYALHKERERERMEWERGGRDRDMGREWQNKTRGEGEAERKKKMDNEVLSYSFELCFHFVLVCSNPVKCSNDSYKFRKKFWMSHCKFVFKGWNIYIYIYWLSDRCAYVTMNLNRTLEKWLTAFGGLFVWWGTFWIKWSYLLRFLLLNLMSAFFSTWLCGNNI